MLYHCWVIFLKSQYSAIYIIFWLFIFLKNGQSSWISKEAYLLIYFCFVLNRQDFFHVFGVFSINEFFFYWKVWFGDLCRSLLVVVWFSVIHRFPETTGAISAMVQEASAFSFLLPFIKHLRSFGWPAASKSSLLISNDIHGSFPDMVMFQFFSSWNHKNIKVKPRFLRFVFHNILPNTRWITKGRNVCFPLSNYNSCFFWTSFIHATLLAMFHLVQGDFH